MPQRFDNIISGCAHYIAILSGRPNAWGVNLDANGQPSHHTLLDLTSQFGAQAVQDELKRQFCAQRADVRPGACLPA